MSAFGLAQREESKVSDTFDRDKDLLLAQFDCKTDVDDLHTIAALATLLAHPTFSGVHYFAVAGTYGIQEGLYVPANPLFDLAFGDQWTDAHNNFEQAEKEVMHQIRPILAQSGDIWIAEAGQSDFTERLIKAIRKELPHIAIEKRLHVVQHSDWNEKSTSSQSLTFIQQNTDYIKIPDGNISDNGSPNFRSADFILKAQKINNHKLRRIWQKADMLCNQFNGKDGRYDNDAITNGGVDFSDLVETCYIFELDIADSEGFFSRYLN